MPEGKPVSNMYTVKWNTDDPFSPYQDQLNDPRWSSKRQRVLERDDFKCKKCSSEHNLQVHHLWYIPGRMAWEYYNCFLITLCDACHRAAHNIPEPKKKSTLEKWRDGEI